MAGKIPLEQVKGITSELRTRMKSLDIMYVEDFISYYTAVKEDTSVLAGALGISEEELASIIEQAKKVVPKDVLKELTSPPPVDEMPYGALDPEDID